MQQKGSVAAPTKHACCCPTPVLHVCCCNRLSTQYLHPLTLHSLCCHNSQVLQPLLCWVLCCRVCNGLNLLENSFFNSHQSNTPHTPHPPRVPATQPGSSHQPTNATAAHTPHHTPAMQQPGASSSPAAAPPPLSGGSSSSIGDAATFGVVTVSDRASSGVYEDQSGPAILQFFKEAVASPWTAKYVVIPDEQPTIEATLKDLVCAQQLGNGSERVDTCWTNTRLFSEQAYLPPSTTQHRPEVHTCDTAGVFTHRLDRSKVQPSKPWSTPASLPCVASPHCCPAMHACAVLTTREANGGNPRALRVTRGPLGIIYCVDACRPTTRAAA